MAKGFRIGYGCADGGETVDKSGEDFYPHQYFIDTKAHRAKRRRWNQVKRRDADDYED